MNRKALLLSLVVCSTTALLTSCKDNQTVIDQSINAQGHTPATQITAARNHHVLQDLPFEDRQDFADAQRGLIARDDQLQVTDAEGEIIWDQTAYQFVEGDAPASVNPSLWRQAQLNNIHGLFKVTEGIYQLRGFDLSNMTIIEGESGWIILDPLTTAETAAKALAFAQQSLGKKPIKAVIFSHSHMDHFGGILGILSAEDAKKNNVRIIAPKGFMEESIRENVLAGQTMARRADYMYGRRLARNARGHVDTGLGKSPAFGTTGILAPTEIVDHTLQEMNIDGVRFIFQNVSGSEAPSELTFYLPDLKAFCGAEMLSRNMHNLYTLRGAKVRDALAWSAYIDEAKNLFADSEIYFASHHWPIWGNHRIIDFMEKQRDTYKYIHDQTLRLAYQGYTPGEIAEEIRLPKSLRSSFSNRGYYGTLRHNSRAVYQVYFGWYDANPANLNPLPPAQSAKHYIKAMGGSDNVLRMAQEEFEQGNYRWVAQMLNHLVFAQPDNTQAKSLLARNYDQLGYQSESGPWRDVYLTGAYELRHGGPASGMSLNKARDMVIHSPRSNFFDVMAAQLNGPKAEGLELTLNINFTDLNENHVITLKNAVLHHKEGSMVPTANATLHITHKLFLDMALGTVNFKEVLFSDQLSIEGNKIDLVRFFSLQDKPDGKFNIVTP